MVVGLMLVMVMEEDRVVEEEEEVEVFSSRCQHRRCKISMM